LSRRQSHATASIGSSRGERASCRSSGAARKRATLDVGGTGPDQSAVAGGGEFGLWPASAALYTRPTSIALAGGLQTHLPPMRLPQHPIAQSARRIGPTCQTQTPRTVHPWWTSTCPNHGRDRCS
jgi:hypothetical protein